MDQAFKAIKALGGSRIADVVRVRMHVSHAEDATAVGNAFKAVFGITGDHAIGFAATVVIAKLVNKGLLCEIEMDAMLASPHV
jgi:enamine deaminase RidA (YjgF/YER057c/UK114 family)